MYSHTIKVNTISNGVSKMWCLAVRHWIKTWQHTFSCECSMFIVGVLVIIYAYNAYYFKYVEICRRRRRFFFIPVVVRIVMLRFTCIGWLLLRCHGLKGWHFSAFVSVKMLKPREPHHWLASILGVTLSAQQDFVRIAKFMAAQIRAEFKSNDSHLLISTWLLCYFFLVSLYNSPVSMSRVRVYTTNRPKRTHWTRAVSLHCISESNMPTQLISLNIIVNEKKAHTPIASIRSWRFTKARRWMRNLSTTKTMMNQSVCFCKAIQCMNKRLVRIHNQQTDKAEREKKTHAHSLVWMKVFYHAFI